MATVYGKSSPVPAPFAGAVDFAVDIPAGNRPIRVLQLTDTQTIDASQQRTPDRLNGREIELWQPEAVDVQSFDHIRTLVAAANPDLIFLTGDLVYGEFDDSGDRFAEFCAFMDGFGIPWAPVYGNHDTSTARGVRWLNGQFEAAAHCLFRVGTVTGNGNYSVLVLRDGVPVRVFYMLDSGGDGMAHDPEFRRAAGIAPDQMAWLRETAATLSARVDGAPVPGFAAFHVPSHEFALADREKGYAVADKYVLGVTVPAAAGDFGTHREPHACFPSPAGFVDDLHAAGVDGVFVGHCHGNNTSVVWQGIRWTYGLKTGEYDFHIFNQVGGTLVTLWDGGFDVHHIPTHAWASPHPNPERF